MKEYELTILEIKAVNNNLNIEVEIQGTYSPIIRSPKLALFFDNGKEIRRVPMQIIAYYPEKNLQKFVLFAEQSYDLRYIFFESAEISAFSIYFEFIYGNDRIHRIPFKYQKEMKLPKNAKYNILKSDSSNEIKFINKHYSPEKKISLVVGLITSCFRGIWNCILFVITVLLTPVFIIEAVLEQLHCAASAPKNKEGRIKRLLNHIRWRYGNFSRMEFGIRSGKLNFFKFVYKLMCLKKIKQNRVSFLSNRRDDLSGNFEYVHTILKQHDDLEFIYLLDSSLEGKDYTISLAFKLALYLATSKAILVDDFFYLLYQIEKRKGTNLFQLWHACGAFKTFGFSRTNVIKSKKKQREQYHRSYDYTIVSSEEISEFYAEGFGLSLEKVKVTGIPRTDIFFDAEYKMKVRHEFYEKYPKFKGKKVLLFAPTFRGSGKSNGNYPVFRFDLKKVYETLGEDYAIIVKHHPFVQDRNDIPNEYMDYIIDLSNESEINDLLFVADLLVTDYSSVIFEAALLDIPMIFYAFDLHEYISRRVFYYEYELFVPGKIVNSEEELLITIRERDFEFEKIQEFKTRFFDDLDGKSSERVARLILETIKK